MHTVAEVRARLDRATESHRLLEHPFYKAWSAGTLAVEDLRFYAAQYWRQVESFPGYLDTLIDRVDDDPARAVLRANLSDEVIEDHPGMWLGFAEALGSTGEEVTGSGVEPETQSCVDAFSDAAGKASVPFALGMIYGYESQTPEVAGVKVGGLRSHYGIGDGTEYFELHAEKDVEHSAEIARAITGVIRADGDLVEAAAGARAGAEAIWGLLDGVARVRAID